MTFFADDPDAQEALTIVERCTCRGGGICVWCSSAAAAHGNDGSSLSLRPDSRTWFDDVLRFVRGAQGDKAIPESVTFKSENVELYWKLIGEELLEMQVGSKEQDPIEFADGIADTIWVLMGLAIASGIDLRPVWAEVSRSNMDKLGGPRRPDGKLLKSAGWRPPDIAAALRAGRLR